MNKRVQGVLWVAVAVIILWLGYSALSGVVPATQESTGPIKLGFIGPLTGDTSSIGTVNRAAVELAAEEINDEGGIDGRELQVVYEDGQCNAKAASNAASKLINVDGVVAIVGGLCSTETSAFAPAAMQSKVIVFSYGSSAPSLSKTGKYFFRSYPSDAFQGKFAAEYAYNTLEARKVAIIYHISEWGTGIKDVFETRFKELGGTIVGTPEGTPQESRDYRTALSKIKALNPDLIYSPMYSEGSIAALKQARELGIKTKFLGADAWDDPKLHTEASGKGEFYFSAPVNLSPEDFKEKVTERTGGDQVPIGTPNAYDNVKILAQVIEKVGTDPDKMQEELRKTEYDGVSGQIAFDANGDVTSADYVVKKIQNGGAVELE